jgi:integrase
LNRTEPIKDLTIIKKLGDYLREVNTRDYILLRSFLYLGLRTQDTLTLRVKDVRGKYKIHFKEKKTGKTKIIEIHPSLIPELEDYVRDKEDDDFLFRSQMRDRSGNRRPLSREQAFRRLQLAADQCNLGVSVSGHVLRKTFCYHSYMNGTPLHVLSELLNHSSEAVTRRYIGLNQENIKEAYLAVNFD